MHLRLRDSGWRTTTACKGRKWIDLRKDPGSGKCVLLSSEEIRKGQTEIGVFDYPRERNVQRGTILQEQLLFALSILPASAFSS